jgi:hypothetical protein
MFVFKNVKVVFPVFFQWSEDFKGLTTYIVFLVMISCFLEVEYQSFTLTVEAAFPFQALDSWRQRQCASPKRLQPTAKLRGVICRKTTIDTRKIKWFYSVISCRLIFGGSFLRFREDYRYKEVLRLVMRTLRRFSSITFVHMEIISERLLPVALWLRY